MIHSPTTPVPECAPEEVGEERAPGSRSLDPEVQEPAIEEDMDRCTIASPPPDFGFDDPTLRDPLVNFGVEIHDSNRDTAPDLEADGDRPTLVEDVPGLDDRHDTDPAPPPEAPDAE
jgi:hypothetical protein